MKFSKMLSSIMVLMIVIFLAACNYNSEYLLTTYVGEDIKVYHFNYNEDIDIENPVIEGFVFEGWYLDQAFTNKFNETKMPQKDLSLYAFVFDPMQIPYDISIENSNDNVYLSLGKINDQKVNMFKDRTELDNFIENNLKSEVAKEKLYTDTTPFDSDFFKKYSLFLIVFIHSSSEEDIHIDKPIYLEDNRLNIYVTGMFQSGNQDINTKIFFIAIDNKYTKNALSSAFLIDNLNDPESSESQYYRA